MNDDQLLRYSRQLSLSQIDFAGQQKLLDSHVVVIGLGGLGSPVAMYLASAGVGSLTLVDDDTVEISNLQRQIIHGEQDVGRLKVESAAASIAAINSQCQLTSVSKRLDGEALYDLVEQADVVVDCTDNFTSRFLLNDVTQQLKVPLVSGAAIRMEGQVSVYNPRVPESPCYQCVYQNNGELGLSCSETGVLAPLLGIIGSIQAVETIKLIVETGETLSGRLLILDATTMSWREMRLRQNPDCPICSNRDTDSKAI